LSEPGAGQRCQSLVLLVGANPLPNYLAAATLRPERVVLVYTERTKDPKGRLALALRERLGVGDVQERWIDDPTRAVSVRAAVRGLGGPGTHLHYTGGTKSMAVHAHAELGRQLTDGDASYLDEERHLIRFDDGDDMDLSDDLLDLDLVLALHGVEPVGREKAAPELAPSHEDLLAVVQAVLDRPELARELLLGSLSAV